MHKTPRVIHVVESLHRGAVENWLLRMMAHGHAHGLTPDWTFYCQLSEPGDCEHIVRDMGGKIIRSPAPLANVRAFMAALRMELRQGHYEVMHCHHDLLSAVYVAASWGMPIKRFIHVHNADENLPTRSNLKSFLLREPMRQICLSADKVIGISNHTLDKMLAGRPRRHGRDIVHYYGVDPDRFREATRDRSAFRRSLDCSTDALILLFGRRITPEKNPTFVVDILAALRRSERRAVAVFAGAGSLEDTVTTRALELGVSEHIRLIGWRRDLADVMSASDWFILPRPERPMEGFGLAVVEAQLAGLRLLLSCGVPDDPLLPTAIFRRLSLSDPARVWANKALEMLKDPKPSRGAALAALEASPMNMDRAYANLISLYQ